jgi:RHS repeat-associated protein
VIGELTRTVWGAAALREGSTAGTPLRFLGHYEDEETGLFYNRYRYYDPAVGWYICSSCGKMFETLKIIGAVVGAKGKRGQHGKYSRPKGY